MGYEWDISWASMGSHQRHKGGDSMVYVATLWKFNITVEAMAH